MSRLLSTEFFKLRGKLIAALIIAVVFAAMCAFASMASSCTVYLGASAYLCIFGGIICGAAGVFISQDFANNTVRNKLIIGHKRLNIYLSYQIIFAISAFVLTAVFLGAYLLSGKLFTLIGMFDADKIAADTLQMCKENFFKSLPVFLAAMPAYTALGVFISVTLKNVSGGVLTIILAYMLNMLPIFDEVFPDNQFLSYVNQILPSSQIFLMERFSAESDFSPVKYILFSMAFAVVLIALGYALFRKSDLK